MLKPQIAHLLFLFCLLLSFSSNAQIGFGTVNPGPYGRGSSIAVPITVGNASCFAADNQFQLFLSDSNGNFAAEVQIGSVTGFYTTYINGDLPGGSLIPGTYRLRVKTTNPASTIDYPGNINILNGIAPFVGATPSMPNQVLATGSTYGWCGSAVGDNKSMFLTDDSTTPTTQTLSVKNEKTGTVTVHSPVAGSFELSNLGQSYYTITATAVRQVGADFLTSTKSYLLLNVLSKISIQSEGSPYGCIDPENGIGALIMYKINTSGTSGIQENYPGSTYRITWGDNSTDVITHCNLINSTGIISHTYQATSCGLPPIDIGNGNTITDSYNVSATSLNPFCTGSQATASIYPKIYTKPQARIQPLTAPAACLNTPITFTNRSIPGNNSDCSLNMRYTWYVDNTFASSSASFTHPGFTTTGIHTIKLVAENDMQICGSSADSIEICIQAPPQLSFNFNGNPTITSCVPDTIKPNNTSVIDENCNTDNVWNWTITGGTVGYANGTSANSREPEFIFTNPGVYSVSLSINTASCGTFSIPAQTIVINSPPTASLSPDVDLCNIGIYNFTDATNGDTRTVLTGTSEDLPTTYTWTVTGGAYSFVAGTNANTKFPSIEFLDYATYTITVTHTNSCGTVSDIQRITFIQSPVVNAGAYQPICYSDQLQLNGSITGVYVSARWQGNGTFTPGNTVLDPVYTPTLAERNAGQATLRLIATTSLAAPCNEIPHEVIIIIKPRIIVNSPATASICTGTALNYAITSNLAGTTYTWTATGSANAGGFAATGSGATINDQITNTDPVNDATVTYTITPTNDGCQGDPFTLTVTITPNPVMTAVPANATICNNQATAITLAANLSNTTYIWTSVASAGITGNSQGLIPSNTTLINDILSNSGATPGTVTYTFTPMSASNCPGDTVQITITVEPTVTTAAAGQDESICNATTYNLNGNEPVVGTGRWTVVLGPSGSAFTNDTQYNTQVTGLQAGQIYTFAWTISGAPGCPTSTDNVTITVDLPTLGGTTTGTATVCAGNNGGLIELTGHRGTILNWESSEDNGVNWQTIATTAASYTYTNLATTTLFRAVVRNGSCAPENSTPVTITVTPGTVVADAGPNQLLCGLTSATLAANVPTPNTGMWTVISALPATFSDPASPTTTVTGLVAGQVYIFRWTITGSGPCPQTSDEVTINNLFPISNNTITNTTPTVCTGQTITVSGTLPSGGDGNYIYVWQSSNDGGTTWVDIAGQNSRDLSLVLTETLSFRRLVSTNGGCTSTSNAVIIIAQPPITNNSISADQTICAGTTPAALTGTAPTGGDGNFNYQWQSSTDNGTTWTDITAQTFPGLTLPVLNNTTAYRRLVSSIQCAGDLRSTSNTVTITVNPNAIAEFSWSIDNSCTPFIINSQNIVTTTYPDRNQTYTWYVNDSPIGTGPTFPGYIITTGNTGIRIKLEVTSSLGCRIDTMSHVFSTRDLVVASFTKDIAQGCGNTTVTFTNTTPLAAGATYSWDFGDNSGSNLRNPLPHVFLPRADARDTTYYVTLTVTTDCGSSTTAPQAVLVKSLPIPILFPSTTSGCSPLSVIFSNTSEGTATKYSYNFGDGSSIIEQETKDAVEHIFVTSVTRDFKVAMMAENECGTVTDTIVIRVFPNNVVARLFVDGPELEGCAPHTVNFRNTTSGANRFTYDFDDGIPSAPSNTSPETRRYTFTRGGTYNVRLIATNGCSTDTSEVVTITVHDQPNMGFTADQRNGCPDLEVKFRNQTTGAVAYSWDFGDGSVPSNLAEPTHVYTGSQEYYTVTLIATNSLGCADTLQIPQFIHIVPPPVAQFNVLPFAQISIPNYTFRFEDESSNNPDQWEWDFGDDSTPSNSRNPTHTYLDTGSYRVRLKVTNQTGCIDTISKVVRIVGVPGQLYVPNSFIPGSDNPELREFRAKGSGIKSWRFSIFDKWGALLWETTKLDDSRPVEAWNGTFRGSPMPQGIYFWKIDLQFINGTEWKGMTYDKSAPKRTGAIYLIR